MERTPYLVLSSLERGADIRRRLENIGLTPALIDVLKNIEEKSRPPDVGGGRKMPFTGLGPVGGNVLVKLHFWW